MWYLKGRSCDIPGLQAEPAPFVMEHQFHLKEQLANYGYSVWVSDMVSQ